MILSIFRAYFRKKKQLYIITVTNISRKIQDMILIFFSGYFYLVTYNVLLLHIKLSLYSSMMRLVVKNVKMRNIDKCEVKDLV